MCLLLVSIAIQIHCLFSLLASAGFVFYNTLAVSNFPTKLHISSTSDSNDQMIALSVSTLARKFRSAGSCSYSDAMNPNSQRRLTSITGHIPRSGIRSRSSFLSLYSNDMSFCLGFSTNWRPHFLGDFVCYYECDHSSWFLCYRRLDNKSPWLALLWYNLAFSELSLPKSLLSKG